jgi:putative transposase
MTEREERGRIGDPSESNNSKRRITNLHDARSVGPSTSEQRAAPSGARTEKSAVSKAKKKPKKTLSAVKTRKIRLNPSPEMKAKLLRWMRAVRWTYNTCLEHVRKRGSWKVKPMRSKCVNDDNFKNDPDKQWVLETPLDMSEDGMNDLIRACDAQMAARKSAKTRNQAPVPFRVKFRSANDSTQTLVVHPNRWASNKATHVSYGNIKDLNPCEPLPERLAADCRIIRTRWGKWYFILCLPLSVRREDEALPECDNRGDVEPFLAGVAAIDPGVRTFNSVYDAGESAFFEWGAHDFNRINRLCRAADKLRSLTARRDKERQHLDRVNLYKAGGAPEPRPPAPPRRKGQRRAPEETRHRERYRYRRAANRIRIRVRNFVDDLHNKMTRWLVERYRVVLLPKSGRQCRVSSRCSGKIDNRTARSTLTWDHQRFRHMLLAKTREYP